MDSQFEKLLSTIYNVVAYPEQWEVVLNELSDSFGLYGCNIFCIDEVEQELNTVYLSKAVEKIFPKYLSDGISEAEFGLSKAVYQFKSVNELVTEKSIIPIALRNGLITEDELAKTHKFMRDESKIFNRIATMLTKRSGRLDTMTFLFHEEVQNFLPEQYQDISRLLPHISNVIDINRPFFLLKQRFNAVFNVLDKFQLGVVLVDSNSNIVLKNKFADKIVEKGDFIRVSRQGALTSNDRDFSSKITKFITSHTDSKQWIKVTGSLSYPSNSIEPKYIVELSQIDGSDLYEKTLFLVIILDTMHSEIVDLSGVTNIYQLSQSESAVAKSIVDGFTNNEIADIRGSSAETIKTQVSSIFQKTGSRRRSDLINLAHKINIPIVKS